MLNVTEGRVRQMADSGLLKPLPIPGRAHLYWRADVRAYAAENSTTLAARSLSRPAKPLRLDTDVIIWWEPEWTLRGPVPLHVRIYRGQHTVVVLSEPSDRHLLTNHIEQMVPILQDRFLHGADLSHTVWVDITPPMSDYGQRPQTTYAHVRNIIFRRDDDGGAWSLPEWVTLTGDDLNHLMGGDVVDGFDWATYTPDLVEQWQRTGRPVPTHFEPDHMPYKVGTYRALHDLGRPDLTRDAQHAILGEITLWQSSPGLHRRREFEPYGSEVLVDLPLTTSRPTHYVLPADIVEALPTYDDLLVDWEVTVAAYERIHEAIEQVSEYADQPSPHAEELLRRTLAWQRDLMILADGERGNRYAHRPSHHLRVFRSFGDHFDRVYVAGIRPDVDLPDHHRRRLLSESLTGSLDVAGADPFGNPAAVDPRGGLIVLWPTTYPAAGPLPDGVHIVAEQTDQPGARPAYVVRRGAIIGLLPYRDPQDGEWAYGYGGSGPHTLAAAIISFLTEHRNQPVTEATEQQVTRQVIDTAGPVLDINIDSLP